jgi:hypothetical protein
MSSFGEILADFKKSEEPDSIVPLIDGPSLRNGLVAWKSVAITYKAAEECPYTAKWNWLWTRVEYDTTRFGVIAGVRVQDASVLLQRLIGLRLVYPDGTIHKFGKQYLQSLIFDKLKKRK